MGQRRPIFVPFGAGQDEKADPRSLGVGQWASIFNGQFNKRGRLTQRNGYAAFGKAINTGGNVAAPIQRPIGYGSELLLIDGNSALYSAQESGSWAAPSTANKVPAAVVDRVTVYDSTQTQTSPDMASDGTFTVRIWMNNLAGAFPDYRGDLYAAIYDASTGATVQAPKLLASNVGAPRVQIANSGTSTAVVMCFDAVSGKLKVTACALNVTAPAFTTTFTTINPLNPKYNDSYFDFISLGDRFFCVYQGTNNTNNSLGAFTLATSLIILNQVSVNDAGIAASVVSAIGACADGTGALVAYAQIGGRIASIRFAQIMTVTWGPTALPAASFTCTVPYQVGVVDVSASAALIAVSGANTDTTTGLYTQAINPASGATIGSALWSPRVFVMSRLWTFNGNAYGLALAANGICGANNIQTTAFVLAFGSATGAYQPVLSATIAPRLLSIVSSNALRVYSDVANVYAASATKFVTILSGAVDGITQGARQALIQTTITFRDPDMYTSAPALDTLAIGCGAPSIYDGMRVGEMGFAFYPEVGSGAGAATVSAGGSVDTGSHQYAYVYEFIDARGQRHWSAPSPAVGATTTAGNNTVALQIPCLQITNRQDIAAKVGIAIYRTLAGGGTFFRLTPDDLPAANLNAYGTPYLTITDTASDASISSNPLLYTTSGELPNFCPPSARIACLHKQRLFLAGTDEGRTLWYSKYLAQGFAPGFNDALTIYFSAGGDITGLASLDDKLVVFKSDRIFILYGDGPQDNGTGADWQIQTVATDGSGCIAANSVTVTDEGVWFQAKRGIMLLDRGLNLHYIGAPVEDTLATYPTVTSATSLTANSQIRFSLANGSAGSWVVYDSFQKQWSVWGIADSDMPAGSPAGLGALWNGNFYWSAVPGGMTYVESATAGVDGAAPYFIFMTATSGHINLGGLSGYQRVRRVQVVADVVSQVNITLVLNPDYGAFGTQTVSWPTGADRLEVMPVVQKCAAMQLTLQTNAGIAATNGAPEFIGLELECVFDARLYKGIKPANRQ